MDGWINRKFIVARAAAGRRVPLAGPRPNTASVTGRAAAFLLELQVCCVQYPLRPAHVPLDSVQSVKVKSETSQVELQLAVAPHGENYSRSRGEAYARDADMAPSHTTPVYRRC